MTQWIIGGGGFTGRHLAKALLDRGERVILVDLESADDPALESAEFRRADIRSPDAVATLDFRPDDVVHQLAARQYHGPVPRFGRQKYFEVVNRDGTRHVLEQMRRRRCNQMVFFSTDMVYGIPEHVPIPTDHPRHPLGPYGQSKCEAEDVCAAYRRDGFSITIFRPRLIVGPGRLGVLAKLFAQIARGRPVPLIGDGSNHYQMVSVHDCVAADLLTLQHGVLDGTFNLGSARPPLVRELLTGLIDRAGSRSRLVATPASAVKAALGVLDLVGLTVLHREQYGIADVTYLVDTTTTEQRLGWQPRYSDQDMINAAYDEYMKRLPREAEPPRLDRSTRAG